MTDESATTKSAFYQKRFALAGKINSLVAEISFDTYASMSFWDSKITVSNVDLEVIEKNIVPIPRCLPKGGISDHGLSVGIAVPHEGLFSLKGYRGVGDTLRNPLKSGATLKIYYTLDNSDPRTSSTRQLYTDSIRITSTTTLKTYAELDRDTLWYPSPVVTEHYTINNTNVLKPVQSWWIYNVKLSLYFLTQFS